MPAEKSKRVANPTAKWVRGRHFISTDRSLLSLRDINRAFAQDYIYWTSELPEDVLRQVIDDSLCFGLYGTARPDDKNPDSAADRTQVGFARLITDNTTFAYITDLYVLPEHQGTGLGGWLLDCIDEYMSAKPYLRWTMLRTSNVRSKEAYQKRLGMAVLENGESGPFVMGKKGKGCMA